MVVKRDAPPWIGLTRTMNKETGRRTLKPIIPTNSTERGKMKDNARGWSEEGDRERERHWVRANFTSLKIYRRDVKALIKAELEHHLRFRKFHREASE